MRRRLAAVALVIGFCAGVVVTRAVWQGRGALDDGDRAFAAGDHEEAIRWWRRAARWYVPLAPHVADAYDRLESIARAAEAKGDVATALAAWQGVRGSILATRSFYVPFEERLEPANRRIAALLARVEGGAPDPGQSEAARTAWHYDLLARDEAPDVGWTVLALVGFLAWIGGGALFAWRGISAEDRLVPRAATTAGLMVASGLVLWLLGLYRA
ncbi:MAG TPA: hypothetical protein VK698_11570 [Kofleriaceae bacterium]|nr:hypothetical protein [Kofleriaceae bacterium]